MGLMTWARQGLIFALAHFARGSDLVRYRMWDIPSEILKIMPALTTFELLLLMSRLDSRNSRPMPKPSVLGSFSISCS